LNFCLIVSAAERAGLALAKQLPNSTLSEASWQKKKLSKLKTNEHDTCSHVTTKHMVFWEKKAQIMMMRRLSH